MKKVLLVLVSVLAFLSLISCQKDKTDEVIALFEDFCIQNDAAISVNNNVYDAEKSKTLSSASDIKDSSNIEEFVHDITEDKSIDITYNSITVSGSVTYESNSNDDESWTFNNVSIKYKYKSSTQTSEAEAEVTINGTYSWSEKEKAEETVSSKNLVITYKSEAEDVDITRKCNTTLVQNGSATRFISATVDGKSVDVSLVNSKYYKING